MSNTRFLLTLLVVLCVAQSAYAFGAGEIPASSAVSKYAYRHGTIEQVLDKLAKVASSGGFDVGSLVKGVAGAFLSGGGVGALASSVKNSKGNTFTGLDIKRVYFGNWLRDYSQAMDVAGLSKLSDDSILILIMCLGFLSFGYATEEFEITKERLGVYLTVEHINPKGYPSNAQQYDSRLRGPVNDRELEIDPNNGMKRYIASSGDMFDTSSDCIRRHMRRAIELRRSGDEHGSYRELGTALHTLEDFLAHSNYVEIALQKLGYDDVYAHVGDNVKVRAPGGESVPPIVTGTFGSLDFFSSVLGEVGDKLSSATVDDLDAKFADARKQAQNEGNSAKLRNLLSKIPSGNTNDVNAQIDDVERIKQQALDIDPTQLASKEAQRMFIDIFKTHDNIFKSIENTLEEVGLQDMIDELSNALTVFILTAIDPWISPIVKQVKDGITTGMEAIAGTEDQTIVFTDSNASDPTHSVLSKDHYDNLLNAPAGLVAVAVVTHSVTVAVDAWTNHHVDIDQAINKILEAIHHPYFARGDAAVQNDMIDVVRQWIESQSGQEKTAILRGLTKESVKAGRNKREDAESFGTLGHRCGKGHAHGAGGAEGRPYGTHQTSYENSPAASGYGQENVSSYGGRQSNAYGQSNDGTSYGRTSESRPHGRVNQEQSYGSSYGQQQTFGGDSRRDDESSGRYGGQSQSERYQQSEGRYGQSNTGYGNQESTYGQSENRYGQGRSDENRYGTGEYGEKRFGHSDDSSGGRYGQGDNEDRRVGSGRQEGYGGGSSAYGNESNTYGRQQDDTPSYGRRDDNENRYGHSSGRYGGDEVEQSIGRMNLRDNDEGSSRYSQGRQENQFSGRDNDSYGHHGRRIDEAESREQSNYGRRHESEEQRGEYRRKNDDDDGERRHHGGRRRDDDEDGNGYGRRGY